MNAIQHTENGFTIIETMICIFVLSIFTLAICKMQLKSMQANSLATKIINANLEASGAADYLHALDFDNDLFTDGTTGNLPATSPFTIQYTVNDVFPYASSNNFHSVLLTTTWSDSFGDHSIQRTIFKLP